MIAIGTCPDNKGQHIRLVMINHEDNQAICSMHYTIAGAASLMKQLNQAIIEAELLYSPEKEQA